MSSRKEYSSEIGIPESVKTSFERNLLNIEGPQGTTSRIFAHPRIIISLESNKIMLKTLGNVSKREKKMLNTFEAHIQKYGKRRCQIIQLQIKDMFRSLPNDCLHR